MRRGSLNLKLQLGWLRLSEIDELMVLRYSSLRALPYVTEQAVIVRQLCASIYICHYKPDLSRNPYHQEPAIALFTDATKRHLYIRSSGHAQPGA